MWKPRELSREQQVFEGAILDELNNRIKELVLPHKNWIRNIKNKYRFEFDTKREYYVKDPG